MMWKIVGALKVSVIYIYIYIDYFDIQKNSTTFVLFTYY